MVQEDGTSIFIYRDIDLFLVPWLPSVRLLSKVYLTTLTRHNSSKYNTSVYVKRPLITRFPILKVS